MSKGGIPETITLADGTVVNVKDNPLVQSAIATAIQSARQEEKDKLYSAISTLEAQKKVLEGDKKTAGELTETQKKKLEDVEKELVTLKAEKEALEKKEPAKKVDADNPKGESNLTKEDIMEMFEGFSKKQSEAFDAKIESLNGKLSTKTVSDYREKAIAKYDGVIISDFVPENLKTEEDVDKAIQTALEKSKKYITKEYDIDGQKQKMTLEEFEAFEKENKSDDPAGGEGGKTPTYKSKTTPDKPDGGGGGDLTGKDLLSKINEMTDEEYAKNHDQILKEAKSFTYTGGVD